MAASVTSVYNLSKVSITMSSASGDFGIQGIDGQQRTTIPYKRFVSVPCDQLPTLRIKVGDVVYALPDNDASCAVDAKVILESNSVPLKIVSGNPGAAGALRYVISLKYVMIYPPAPLIPRVCKFVSEMDPTATTPTTVTVVVDGGAAVSAPPFTPVTIPCPSSKVLVIINGVTAVQMDITTPLKDSNTARNGPYTLTYRDNVDITVQTMFRLSVEAESGGIRLPAPPSNSRIVNILSMVDLKVSQLQTEPFTPNTIDRTPTSNYDVTTNVIKTVGAFPDTVFKISLKASPSTTTTITFSTENDAQAFLGEYEVVLLRRLSIAWQLNVRLPSIARPPPRPPSQPPMFALTPSEAPSLSPNAFPVLPPPLLEKPSVSHKLIIGIGIAALVVVVLVVVVYFIHRHKKLKKGT